MNRRVLLALVLLVPALALAQTKISPDDVIEYEPVVPPMATSTGEQIEVIELFWYGCPHCYRLEPYIERWLEHKPDNVAYVRIPAIFPNRPVWENHARAFYTAEVLGVIDTIHRPLFDALHALRRKLNDEDALAVFFAEMGVDEAEFRKTYRSFAVDGKVRRAKDLTRRYGINGVPSLIVDGRYRSGPALAGTYARTMPVIDALVQKAAAERAKTAAK